jgi:hypothetical protein
MPGRRLQIEVVHSAPCSESWETMPGNSKVRRCDACNKQVHNFAGMTAGEIEKLIDETAGRLCARILRGPDGSVQMLEQQSKQPLAAGFVLAASLAMGTAASAQTTETTTAARLSGKVLSPEGSTSVKGVAVTLLSDGKAVATAETDSNGSFTITTEPGQYDLLISQNMFRKSSIPNVNLHAGDQSVQSVRLKVQGSELFTPAFTGVVVIVARYPIRTLFTHPIRYLKNIRHQL